MLLTDRDIRAEINTGRVTVKPFAPARLQPASVDLTLAGQYRVHDSRHHEVIDPQHPAKGLTAVMMIPAEGLVLHPGDFILGATREHITLPPDLAGRVEGKSSLGRHGLVMHSTAGWIDPGFAGQVTLELSNVNRLPIRLRPGMPIGQLCLFRCTSPAEWPYGHPGLRSHYQHQSGPTEAQPVQ